MAQLSGQRMEDAAQSNSALLSHVIPTAHWTDAGPLAVPSTSVHRIYDLFALESNLKAFDNRLKVGLDAIRPCSKIGALPA